MKKSFWLALTIVGWLTFLVTLSLSSPGKPWYWAIIIPAGIITLAAYIKFLAMLNAERTAQRKALFESANLDVKALMDKIRTTRADIADLKRDDDGEEG